MSGAQERLCDSERAIFPNATVIRARKGRRPAARERAHVALAARDGLTQPDYATRRFPRSLAVCKSRGGARSWFAYRATRVGHRRLVRWEKRGWMGARALTGAGGKRGK